MCCRNRPPGQDLEEHKCASCQSLPAGRRVESLQSWKDENTVSSSHICQKKTCKSDKQVNRQMSLWQDIKFTAGDDSPLKYLSDDQEADSDGYGSPEVLWFRKHFAIMVLQVIPAVAHRKPNPVRPYHLTQPRQHPKDGEVEREKDERGFCIRQMEIKRKEGFNF